MKKRIKRYTGFFTALLFAVLLGTTGQTVQAAEIEPIYIEAKVLPSDAPTFDVQVTVRNLGTDWEGIVRLKTETGLGYGSYTDCAYDTALSLPEGSTKQFTVRLPKDSIDRTDGYVRVTLLDRKMNSVAEKMFPKLLQNDKDALSMGVLSDAYASLTYLDMGGNELYYGDRTRPIKLVQLQQGSFVPSLNGLAFLVIDSFNTQALTDEERTAIESWVDKGGMLIVGTGSQAEKTLDGLSFLEIEYSEADDTQVNDFGWDDFVDTSKLTMVEFSDPKDTLGGYYQYLQCGAPWGDGSVSLLPCALTDLGALGADAYLNEGTQESLVERFLNNAVDMAKAPNQSGTLQYNTDYNLERIFTILGRGSNRLQFGGLKLLVVVYVIFVGPVLYLILRALKKRDFYWIAVPIASLAGIFLIYWAGRGFEVASTSVYSVSMEDLSDKENVTTYLRCYDAGHTEWSLSLADGYTYAGPMMGSRYYYSDEQEGSYYQRIQKEGERFAVGIRPKKGFEDAYFTAGKAAQPHTGTLSWDGDKTVTNETQWDFPYFAVITDDSLLIYRNLAAGERFSLADSTCEYMETVTRLRTNSNVYAHSSNSYTPAEAYYYGYLREMMWDDDDKEARKDIDIKAALGMGISYACVRAQSDDVIIVGVAPDWNKAADGDCSEVSYGCLYAIVEE